MGAPPAEAFHFFRGDGNGGCGGSMNPTCCPADGELTDDPRDSISNQIVHGPLGATVELLHNTFNDEATLLPIVRIRAGQSVQWNWWSSHCHSVSSDTPGLFESGFFFPATPPESPKVVPAAEYPVPDMTPTLYFIHTFKQTGMFAYHCVHHNIIGMVGMVIVDP